MDGIRMGCWLKYLIAMPIVYVLHLIKNGLELHFKCIAIIFHSIFLLIFCTISEAMLKRFSCSFSYSHLSSANFELSVYELDFQFSSHSILLSWTPKFPYIHHKTQLITWIGFKFSWSENWLFKFTLMVKETSMIMQRCKKRPAWPARLCYFFP